MTVDRKPLFKGFTIELPPSNVSLNIQDINGNIISGAQVDLDFIGQSGTSLSNLDGCAALMMQQGLVYNITIKKQNYKDHVGKIVMIPKSGLVNPDSNFVIKVVGSNNLPLQAANISLTRAAETINGVSTASGIFEAIINTGFDYNLLVSKSGYGTFSSNINSFVKYSCGDTNFLIISAIKI